MRQPERPRPSVIVPDTSPLVHLAAAGALDVLHGMGRVFVMDVVALEATADPSKPYAADIARWIEAGGEPGANRPVHIVATEIGPLFRLALQTGTKPPRNAGEIGIAEWRSGELRRSDGPALVVYENGRVPAMLAREGVSTPVAIVTTRSLLDLAQREGVIADADAAWRVIAEASPSANPVSAITYLEPTNP